MISFKIETIASGKNLSLQTSFITFDVTIANFKNLLDMAVLEERLYKTGIEKVSQKFWVMYHCILNVPLWNNWSKVTYSQVRGSQVLKALLSRSLNWISTTAFPELIQFGQDPKLTNLLQRKFCGSLKKYFMFQFHWRNDNMCLWYTGSSDHEAQMIAMWLQWLCSNHFRS